MRRIVVGAAGSGKTTAVLKHAWKHAKDGVTLFCLPHQRQDLVKRLSEEPTLNVRVTDLQSVAYEVLERGGNEKNFLSIPGRVALLGRLLMSDRKDYPTPGEAALYAHAIGDLKKQNVAGKLDPRKVGAQGKHLLGLAARYQQELQERHLLDLDDVRLLASELLENGLQWSARPQHLLIDGYSELNPLELRLIRALALTSRSLILTLPANAPYPYQTRLGKKDLEGYADFLKASVTELSYKALPAFTVQVYPNVTREARQVVAQVKAALLEGIPASEMAVVVPRDSATANLLKLAEEARIPLLDEQPGTPVDSFHGRKLMTLLSTRRRNYPTRDLFDLSMFYEGLNRVAEELEGRGLNGIHAHLLEDVNRESLSLLMLETAPTDGSSQGWLNWIETLLDRIKHPESSRDPIRIMAREVFELIPAEKQKHTVLEDWLMALLPSVAMTRERQEGVRVLTPEQITGRRFQKLWLMNATEHQYLLEEKEDFFFTEEERLNLGLPRSMRGIAESLFYEVFTRALQVTLSYASADRDGVQRPHRLLAQMGQATTPQVMPMSPLEYALSTRDIKLGSPDWWSKVPPVQENRAWMLTRYLPCKLRGYLSSHTEKPFGGLFSRQDRTRMERLLRQSAWEAQPEPVLDGVYSDHFKQQVARHLKDNLPPRPDLPNLRVFRDFKLGEFRFRPHAYQPFNDTRKANIYVVTQEPDIRTLLKNNPEHLWVYAAFQQAGWDTELYTWDLYAKPRRRSVFDNQARDAWKQLHDLKDSLAAGDVTPSAGFHCFDCTFKQVCRIG
ncbi:UvrD-helicase domain-containing protein [Deinococcus roseus]|uniref:UvrD-like helicase ATP-binding domain-containing protein n=1 Tax=Deinococcus roseus TaxID=392414 RepID=A0ABQ2D264_9DEIO|nr:UvrD-helicase domain-containing protein [Deinococcus roseus]GGJ41973.1 hypothetical protein GCM10008938_30010 [Deinococcus roseus]